MSAKGRARADYVEPAHDDYPTPAWAVERMLEPWATELHNAGRRWIEPCAGAGTIISATNRWFADNAPEGQAPWRPEWTAVELQYRYAPALRALGVASGALADFRLWAKSRERNSFDVCVTNPPYDIAAEILGECQRICRVTVALLRMPYLASEERSASLRAWTPDVASLPNRPQFVQGGSDNADYGWLRWTDGRQGEPGRVIILGTTPEEIRYPNGRKAQALARGRA